MAWTAPITWVTAEIPTAALFNTHIRDNFLALDQHGHGGSSGDGGTSLGDLVKGTFTDAAAPTAPGAGKTSVYSVSGKPHYRAGAAGADTLLSAEGHAHTFTEEDQGANKTSAGTGGGSTGLAWKIGAAPGGGTRSASTTLNPTKAAMIVGAGAIVSQGVPADSYKHEIIIDGVVAKTISAPATMALMQIIGSREVASGARTVEHKMTNDHSSNNWDYFTGLTSGMGVQGAAIII